MMQTQDFYSAYSAAAPGNKPSAGRPQHLSSSAPPPGMMTSTAASMPQYSQQYAIPQQPMTHNAPMNSGLGHADVYISAQLSPALSSGSRA